ncbi:MAG: class I SAM-dependent methyltransferase [Sphingomonadales bacterium]|nr:class I SAM-dependent methyltransferase [Sphingomonadales bacterium]
MWILHGNGPEQDYRPEQRVFQSEYQAETKESYFDKERRCEISGLQLDFLTKLNVQSHTLLDIGCGDGIFARESARCGWNVIGLDPATPTIGEPTENPPNLKLFNGTLDDLAPDEKFKCVTMWDVVEHLPDPDPVLRNAWSVYCQGLVDPRNRKLPECRAITRRD